MVAMAATDARHGQLLMPHGQLLMPPGLLLMPPGLLLILQPGLLLILPPGQLLMPHGLLLMSYGLPPMPHGLLPGPARHIMPLLRARFTSLPSHGMNTPVRRHTTMRRRPVSTTATSLAMRTIVRVQPFRCGMMARSARGNGSRRNG